MTNLTDDQKQSIAKSSSARYVKTQNTFKSSNFELDLDTMTAKSYGWWDLVKVIDGKVVFNNIYYSSSTCKHQSKARRILDALNIKVDIVLEAPKGLQDLESAIGHYEYKIKELVAAMQKPRSQAKKNAERAEQVEFLQGQIETVKTLMKKA